MTVGFEVAKYVRYVAFSILSFRSLKAFWWELVPLPFSVLLCQVSNGCSVVSKVWHKWRQILCHPKKLLKLLDILWRRQCFDACYLGRVRVDAILVVIASEELDSFNLDVALVTMKTSP